MNGYKILKCFRKEERVSGELPCPATGLIFFLQYPSRLSCLRKKGLVCLLSGLLYENCTPCLSSLVLIIFIFVNILKPDFEVGSTRTQSVPVYNEKSAFRIAQSQNSCRLSFYTVVEKICQQRSQLQHQNRVSKYLQR